MSNSLFIAKAWNDRGVGKRMAGLWFGLCLGLSGGAQAGPVTGNFDPEFGPPLDGLSYRGTYSFYVPDALVPAPGAGTQLVDTSANPLVANVSLTLLETGEESSAVTLSFELNVLSLNIDRALGHLIGFRTDVEAGLDFGPLAPGSAFNFRYLASGLAALEVDLGGIGDVYGASFVNYAMLIRHHNDAGVSRLGEGLALLRTVTGVDGDGSPIFSTQSVGVVPEPSSPALLLGAFGAAALIRRAHRR